MKSFATPLDCSTCETTAPGMMVPITRLTGSEGALNAFDAPEQKSGPFSKMEPNTDCTLPIVSTRHVVVPSGVVKSMVARAKVCIASSCGKPSMERATVCYTNFPPGVTIDDAMRVDKMVRNCSLGRQKKSSSRASACILSSLRRLEVTISLGVGAGE